jgi:hypothetical protein
LESLFESDRKEGERNRRGKMTRNGERNSGSQSKSSQNLEKQGKVPLTEDVLVD